MATPIQIPLTQEQFNDRVAQLATLGVHLTGNEGAISKEGVTVNYHYDGANVTINTVHKPFGVPQSFLDSKIKAWFGVK